MTTENRTSFNDTERAASVDAPLFFKFLYRIRYQEYLNDLREFAEDLQRKGVSPAKISETLQAQIQHYCAGLEVRVDEGSLDVYVGKDPIYINWSTYSPQEKKPIDNVVEEELDAIVFFG